MIQKIKAWQVIAFLLGLGYFLFIVMMNEKEKAQRIKSSFAISQDSLQHSTAKDGKPITTIGVQQLTANEIATVYPTVKKQVQNLNLKLRRVQAVQSIGIVTGNKIVVPVKDSLRKDTTLAIKTIKYTDPYYMLSGYIEKDSAHIHITSRDTLLNVVYKERIRPWLWIFSPTRLIQVIENKNPNSKITYNQTIQVKRK